MMKSHYDAQIEAMISRETDVAAELTRQTKRNELLKNKVEYLDQQNTELANKVESRD